MHLIKSIFKLLSLLGLVVFLFSCSGNNIDSVNKEPYLEARVIKVVSSLTLQDKEYNIESQTARILVKMLTGNTQGEEIIITQQIMPNIRDISIPEAGDAVILSEMVLPDGRSGLQIIDYKRSNTTWVAIILFIICLVLIGGIKGLIFFGFLSFIFLTTMFILFPVISYGVSPVLLTFMLSAMISALVHYFINNSKEKFRIMLASNIISLFVVTIFAYIFSRYGAFASLLTRENIGIISHDFHAAGFIASAIILTALGGIINVSIFTFNHANEVRKLLPKGDLQEMIYATVKYSRPSVFINFLVLFMIYLGLALPVLITRYNIFTVQSIVNVDIISFYLIATSIGGLGIITSSICSCVLSCYSFSLKKAKSGKTLRTTQQGARK